MLYRKWVTSQSMFFNLAIYVIDRHILLEEQYQDHNNLTSTNKNIISQWYTHFLIVWARLSLLGGIVSVDGGRWCSEPVGVCTALPSSVWALCLEIQRVSSLEIQKDKDTKLFFFSPSIIKKGFNLNFKDLWTQIVWVNSQQKDLFWTTSNECYFCLWVRWRSDL